MCSKVTANFHIHTPSTSLLFLTKYQQKESGFQSIGLPTVISEYVDHLWTKVNALTSLYTKQQLDYKWTELNFLWVHKVPLPLQKQGFVRHKNMALPRSWHQRHVSTHAKKSMPKASLSIPNSWFTGIPQTRNPQGMPSSWGGGTLQACFPGGMPPPKKAMF